MNVIAHPGVDENDFALRRTAVSAGNGAGMRLDSLEEEARKRAVPSQAIQTALEIAAVVNAVADCRGERGEHGAG